MCILTPDRSSTMATYIQLPSDLPGTSLLGISIGIYNVSSLFPTHTVPAQAPHFSAPPAISISRTDCSRRKLWSAHCFLPLPQSLLPVCQQFPPVLPSEAYHISLLVSVRKVAREQGFRTDSFQNPSSTLILISVSHLENGIT